jgi:hypothetical protein
MGTSGGAVDGGGLYKLKSAIPDRVKVGAKAISPSGDDDETAANGSTDVSRKQYPPAQDMPSIGS